MDWDDQTQWVTLGKLNRGRGQYFMLSLHGRLSCAISSCDFTAVEL
jgi:hypothetical protein